MTQPARCRSATVMRFLCPASPPHYPQRLLSVNLHGIHYCCHIACVRSGLVTCHCCWPGSSEVPAVAHALKKVLTLPMAAVVLPAASRASVRSRMSSPIAAISAMPPALSQMGPYASMARPTRCTPLRWQSKTEAQVCRDHFRHNTARLGTNAQGTNCREKIEGTKDATAHCGATATQQIALALHSRMVAAGGRQGHTAHDCVIACCRTPGLWGQARTCTVLTR